MDTQPEALRLADAIEGGWTRENGQQAADELRRLHELVEHLQLTVFGFETKLATRGYEIQIDDLKGEVRRLHEVNQELLKALECVIDDLMYKDHARVIDIARATIAKATGEQA